MNITPSTIIQACDKIPNKSQRTFPCVLDVEKKKNKIKTLEWGSWADKANVILNVQQEKICNS